MKQLFLIFIFFGTLSSFTNAQVVNSSCNAPNCLVGPVPANRIPIIDGQRFIVDCRRTANIFHDLVSGYQPYQWQNALHDTHTLNGVKNRLRSLYWNPGEGAELDSLFADYDHVNSKNLYECNTP